MDWNSLRSYIPWLEQRQAPDKLTGLRLHDEVDYQESKFNPESSEKRCQHIVETETLPDDLGGYCCYRPVWDDHDRCIWHVEMSKKPVQEIRSANQFESWLPEKYDHLSFVSRLDETHLARFRAEDDNLGLSIGGCTMANSDFSQVHAQYLSFQNVILSGSTFEHAEFEHANFSACPMNNVSLREAALQNTHFHSSDLRDADLTSALLHGANLYNATLNCADLQYARLLDGVYLHNADCKEVNFEGAHLEGTDLRNTDLTNARMHQTMARSIRLSEGTTFGKKCVYERESDATAETQTATSETAEKTNEHFQQILGAVHRLRNRYYWDGDDSDNLTKSIRIYRLYQRLLRENSLPGDIQHFRVRERHARRKLALAENQLVSWLNLSIQRWAALYGESYWRVIFTSILVILLGSLLYPFFGIRDMAAGTTISYRSMSINQVPNVFVKSLYFSTSTFTTLGYGDLQPIGWARAISTVESFLGAVLIALLVFVFARQATW